MVDKDLGLLLANDTSAFEGNNISSYMLARLDDVIFRFQDGISQEALGIYAKFLPMKQEAPEHMKNELFTAIKNYLREKVSNNEFADVLLLGRFLIVKSHITSSIYSDIAQSLAALGVEDLALEFIELYEQKEPNKPLEYLTLGNFYNLYMKDYKTAIKYYEQYLKIDKTKPVIYTIVGSLYAKVYGDYSLKDQVAYYEKAYKLKPNDRLILHTLAYGYEKMRDVDSADRFYRELLENNPTDTDFYNYGGFLISCGDFERGFEYLTHRFNIDDINLRYPLEDDGKRWNFVDDISQKTLLVMYEQGFGDTIMYCRFVPLLKRFAKRVVFVVQPSLCNLLKSSPIVSEGVEIYSNIEGLEYDVHMALIDAVHVLGINSSEIPYPDGYLQVDNEKIKKYADKYLTKSDNLKVGIAYKGSKSANYHGRDIEVEELKSLFDIEGTEFYSFTMENVRFENLNLLGESFNDFEDTACALKNMDVVISTDNVILNLAGALGVKTYGLFNEYPNFRWFKLSGADLGWYSSVKPYQITDKILLNEVLNSLKENITKQISRK